MLLQTHFRAGAIEQITHHADKLGVKIIKHKKGADPAAVAFDAVEHAKAKGKELVLVDTAGRMQTNINLMDEMKKIKRVIKPDLIIYVGDALTGNDSVEQAQKFNDAVGIDGIILNQSRCRCQRWRSTFHWLCYTKTYTVFRYWSIILGYNGI